MFDLHLVAQAAAAPVQAVPLWQLLIGIVTVILAIIGIAWKAGRTLVTKGDLTKDLGAIRKENEKVHAGITENLMENRRQLQQLDASMRSIDRSLAFLSGRRHEQDRREDLDWAAQRGTPGARSQDDAGIN